MNLNIWNKTSECQPERLSKSIVINNNSNDDKIDIRIHDDSQSHEYIKGAYFIENNPYWIKLPLSHELCVRDSKWISTNDEMPELNEYVLIDSDIYGMRIAELKEIRGIRAFFPMGESVDTVKLWLKLPAIPEDIINR